MIESIVIRDLRALSRYILSLHRVAWYLVKLFTGLSIMVGGWWLSAYLLFGEFGGFKVLAFFIIIIFWFLSSMNRLGRWLK